MELAVSLFLLNPPMLDLHAGNWTLCHPRLFLLSPKQNSSSCCTMPSNLFDMCRCLLQEWLQQSSSGPPQQMPSAKAILSSWKSCVSGSTACRAWIRYSGLSTFSVLDPPGWMHSGCESVCQSCHMSANGQQALATEAALQVRFKMHPARPTLAAAHRP